MEINQIAATGRGTDMTTQQRVDELRAMLAEAEQELAAQREQERIAALHIRIADAVTADDSAFVSDAPRFTGEKGYVLPFGREYSKWNVTDVENHPFGQAWLTGMMGLICKRIDVPRNRPSRVIFASGSQPAADDRVGNSFIARHDQTNAFLGEYEVVGIVVYGTNGNVVRIVGEVPSAKLSLNTYK